MNTTGRGALPHQMLALLENIKRLGTRVRIYTGDGATGECHGEEKYDGFGATLTGRLGMNSEQARVRCWLVLPQKRSMGGYTFNPRDVVRIRHANKRDGGDIYRHPDFHFTN